MYFQVRDFVLGCEECHRRQAEKAEVNVFFFVLFVFDMMFLISGFRYSSFVCFARFCAFSAQTWGI